MAIGNALRVAHDRRLAAIADGLRGDASPVVAEAAAWAVGPAEPSR
jgi:hypothetical protein